MRMLVLLLVLLISTATAISGTITNNETVTTTYSTITGNTATIFGAMLLFVGFAGFVGLVLRAWEQAEEKKKQTEAGG